jgi:hypothetical protein
VPAERAKGRAAGRLTSEKRGTSARARREEGGLKRPEASEANYGSAVVTELRTAGSGTQDSALVTGRMDSAEPFWLTTRPA